jgi:hypothetical protein
MSDIGASSFPEPEDLLFLNQGEIRNIACLNFSPDAWIGYVEGYKRGADALVEHALDSRGDRDYLIYPIIFLYRQYLELQLKKIHIQGSAMQGASGGYEMSHDLRRTWSRIRPFLESRDVEQAELDAVESLLSEFQEKDEGSFAYRYPENRHRTNSIPDVAHINIEHFRLVMGKLYAFFDAISMSLSIEFQQTLEARYHMQADDL